MRRVVANTLAAGTLLVGGTAGYTLAESRNGKPSQGEIACDEAKIVGVTPEKIIYAPVVRTTGRISLGNIYTVADVTTGPTSDSATGAAINAPTRSMIIQPGIFPVGVSLEDQGDAHISIVISDQKPVDNELALGSLVAPCPIQELVVTRN